MVGIDFVGSNLVILSTMMGSKSAFISGRETEISEIE
jgi:hypothetical protein